MLRSSLRFTSLCAGLLISASALALSLGDLSQQDATGGLKDALTQGAQVAVKQLGTAGGFSNNPDVRIELPGNLGKVAKKMKQFGMGAQVEELESSMNKAAEAAVPQAGAAGGCGEEDERGGRQGHSQWRQGFRHPVPEQDQPRADPREVPADRQAGHRPGGPGQQYNAFAGQAATLGVLDAKNANIEGYVTEQALNGLFEMIGKQEATIRENPAAAATSLAKKVFGTL